MPARLIVVVAALGVLAACGGDDEHEVTDCPGGPAGGDAMTVEVAASADLDECEGGFAVRGHAFIEGRTVKLCEAVRDATPTCDGASITARIEGDVRNMNDGDEVVAGLNQRSGRLVMTSLVVSGP